MFQKLRNRLFGNGYRIVRWAFLWCLLVGLLSGCGMGLWLKDGLALEEFDGYKQWLQDGWPVGEENTALSVLFWQFISGTVPTNSYAVLANGFPVLQGVDGRTWRLVTEEETFYASAFITDQWEHQFEKIKELTMSDEVQVLLYHTHNAETYLPSAGVSKVSGQNGGVVQATEVFQEALQQKYGIRTLHNTSLHDYPNWNRSYQNSLNTVQQLLQVHDDVKAVFDIHRDAGFTSKKPTTTMIHGKEAARIMLVIGANHEQWKENLAFARKLETKCNELYPGLLRDTIHIKETGRYNQQVHPHAVLLEIGSDLNTQEEANYALECFAQVVAEVLQIEESKME